MRQRTIWEGDINNSCLGIGDWQGHVRYLKQMRFIEGGGKLTGARGNPSSQSPPGEGKYVSVILTDTANMIMPRNANTVARMRRTALTCHLRSCSLSRRRISIDGIGAMVDEISVDAKKGWSGLLRVRVEVLGL